MKTTLTIAATLLFAASSEAAKITMFIPGNIPQQHKEEIITTIQARLKPGDSIETIHAGTFEPMGTISLAKDRTSAIQRRRAFVRNKDFRRFKKLLDAQAKAPMGKPYELNIPAITDHLVKNSSLAAGDTVILLGNPTMQAGSPDWRMDAKTGRWPSDGLITEKGTVYYLGPQLKGIFKGAKVHLAYLKNPYAAGAGKHITRFWAHYFDYLGLDLMSSQTSLERAFTSTSKKRIVDTCEAFDKEAKPRMVTLKELTLKPVQPDFTRQAPPKLAPPKPAPPKPAAPKPAAPKPVAPVVQAPKVITPKPIINTVVNDYTVSLLWYSKTPVDLDAHLRYRAGAKELSYLRENVEGGYFSKEASSPLSALNGFETVKIIRRSDLKDLVIDINLYLGNVPEGVTGSIMMKTDDGRIFTYPFKLSQGIEGNRGVDRDGDRTGPHWLRVTGSDILGLTTLAVGKKG